MGSYSIRDLNIVRKLESSEKDLIYLKTRQTVGGRTLATKLTIGSKLQSKYEVDPFAGTTELRNRYGYYTFTADNQLNPHAQLYVRYYESDGVTKIDPEDPNAPGLFYFFPIPQDVDSKTCVWLFDTRLDGPVGTTSPFFVEAVVAATDTGVITWVDRGDA